LGSEENSLILGEGARLVLFRNTVWLAPGSIVIVPQPSHIDGGLSERYFLTMSKEQIPEEATALLLAGRVSMAQALRQSIDDGLSDSGEQQANHQDVRLNEELSVGAAAKR
jgi:hypothetical protein